MKQTNSTSSIITMRSYFGVGLIMTGLLAGGCLSGEGLEPSEELGSVESGVVQAEGTETDDQATSVSDLLRMDSLTVTYESQSDEEGVVIAEIETAEGVVEIERVYHGTLPFTEELPLRYLNYQSRIDQSPVVLPGHDLADRIDEGRARSICGPRVAIAPLGEFGDNQFIGIRLPAIEAAGNCPFKIRVHWPWNFKLNDHRCPRTPCTFGAPLKALGQTWAGVCGYIGGAGGSTCLCGPDVTNTIGF